ncbi:MAG: hypothetical protein EXR77_09045 [Myxococcales bacterium]|nr:hypothetical protein [Myxococcales bacterium]
MISRTCRQCGATNVSALAACRTCSYDPVLALHSEPTQQTRLPTQQAAVAMPAQIAAVVPAQAPAPASESAEKIIYWQTAAFMAVTLSSAAFFGSIWLPAQFKWYFELATVTISALIIGRFSMTFKPIWQTAVATGLSVIPAVNLLVFGLVSQHANDKLGAAGYRFGLFGAVPQAAAGAPRQWVSRPWAAVGMLASIAVACTTIILQYQVILADNPTNSGSIANQVTSHGLSMVVPADWHLRNCPQLTRSIWATQERRVGLWGRELSDQQSKQTEPVPQ